jgi:hypothetical protein
MITELNALQVQRVKAAKGVSLAELAKELNTTKEVVNDCRRELGLPFVPGMCVKKKIVRFPSGAEIDMTPPISADERFKSVSIGLYSDDFRGIPEQPTRLRTHFPLRTKPTKYNKLQIVGVCECTLIRKHQKTPYYIAYWNQNGKRKTGYFNIDKLGKDEALRQAKACRMAAQERVNRIKDSV